MLEDAWISLLWVLLCAILIIGLAYWFTRHVVGRSGLGGLGFPGGSERLRVLAQLPVGRDQRLAVVRAGERCFLLGITPSGISQLAEFTPEEAQAWRQGMELPEQQAGFRQVLEAMRKQKRQG